MALGGGPCCGGPPAAPPCPVCAMIGAARATRETTEATATNSERFTANSLPRRFTHARRLFVHRSWFGRNGLDARRKSRDENHEQQRERDDEQDRRLIKDVGDGDDDES